MPGGKVKTARLQLASTGEGVSGPSYFDVRELLLELESEFSVRTQFIIDPGNPGERWKVKQMWIRLRCYKAGSKGHGDLWYGAGLGGNGDSTTMPGAMLAAVLDAWDGLEEERTKETVALP